MSQLFYKFPNSNQYNNQFEQIYHQEDKHTTEENSVEENQLPNERLLLKKIIKKQQSRRNPSQKNPIILNTKIENYFEKLEQKLYHNIINHSFQLNETAINDSSNSYQCQFQQELQQQQEQQEQTTNEKTLENVWNSNSSLNNSELQDIQKMDNMIQMSSDEKIIDEWNYENEYWDQLVGIDSNDVKNENKIGKFFFSLDSNENSIGLK